MKTFELTDLPRFCPAFSPNQCLFYAEGAIVALEKHGHQSGVLLTVDGQVSENFELAWSHSPLKAGWVEKRDSAQFGALAIAFYLAFELTDFTVVEQSWQNTGFDYWLGFNEDDPRYNPDNNLLARLEISGLGDGKPSEIAARVREKLDQTKPTDHLKLAAWIAVTAFGKPISIFKKK